MYFWHIIHKDENELLFKFLEAQELSPSPHDWICQVRQDMTDIRLCLSDDEIRNVSEEMFGKLVKMKMQIFSVKYLKERTGSKTSQLECKSITPSEYLFAPQLNLSKSKLYIK